MCLGTSGQERRRRGIAPSGAPRCYAIGNYRLISCDVVRGNESKPPTPAIIAAGRRFRLERGLPRHVEPRRSPTSPEEQAAGCGRRWIAPAAPSRRRIRQVPAHHNSPHSNHMGSSSLNRVGRDRGSTEAVGGGSSDCMPAAPHLLAPALQWNSHGHSAFDRVGRESHFTP